MRHFPALRGKSDALALVLRLKIYRWCSFTATRQQSLTAMQAAARHKRS
ncbi:hypothetical protein NI35_2070 [Salmonella enterica subsp. enterica serovar Cerro]|nr:hypothetical protein NI35_2070 [Salmonella enterica subsp. enterica serovar Cerro]